MIDWITFYFDGHRKSASCHSTPSWMLKQAIGLRGGMLLGGLAGGLIGGLVKHYRGSRSNNAGARKAQAWTTEDPDKGVRLQPSMENRKFVYGNRVKTQLPNSPATPEQLEKMQKDLHVSPYMEHYAKDFPIRESSIAGASMPNTSNMSYGQMANAYYAHTLSPQPDQYVEYGLPPNVKFKDNPVLSRWFGKEQLSPSVGNMTIFHEGIHAGADATMLQGQRLAHGGSIGDWTMPDTSTVPGLTAAETPSTAATFLHMYEHPEFYNKSPADMTKNLSNKSYYPVMYPHPGIRWDVSDFGEKGLGNGYTVQDAINREAPLPVVHELNGKTRPLNESMLEGSNVRPAHRHDVKEYGPQDLEGFEWDDRTPVTVPSTPMGWVVDRRGNFVEPTRDSQITTMGTLTSAGDIEELPTNFRRIIKNVGHGATQGYKDMKADPGEYYATQEDLQAAMEPLYALSKPGVFYGGDTNTEPTVQEIVSGLLSKDPAIRAEYAPWLNLLQPRIQYKIKSLYNGEPVGNVREELEQLLGHSDWSVMEVPELADEQVLGSYTPGADLEPDMRSLPQMKDSIHRIQEGYRKRNIRALHGDMIGPNVGWS